MLSDDQSIDLFLLFLSSFVVFFIMTRLMEGLLFAFRITNPRLRAVSRYLPVLKLPFDLALYKFSSQSFLSNLNPFSCDGYFQKFLVEWFHVDPEATFSHLISTYIPSICLKGMLLTILLISLGSSFRLFFQFLNSSRYLDKLLKASNRSFRPIFNRNLQNNLNKMGAVILSSKEVEVPFSAKRRVIVFPEKLHGELSQGEFEAVVAHELEHLRWSDPVTKFASLFICSFFWWIPTTGWLKKLENEQEHASDRSVTTYGLDNHLLASAIHKVAKNHKCSNEPQLAICHLTAKRTQHLKRIRTILEERYPPKQNLIKASFGLTAALSSFLLISFWIC